MHKVNTLNQVSEIIAKFTDDFLMGTSSVLSANEVAEKLNVTRSSISRYMNTLFVEKKLIKVHTRPVLFLDVKTFEKKIGIQIDQFDFLSIQEMYDCLKMHEKTYDFQDLIGNKETLFEIINSMKSEISYPGTRMLTMLLHGNKGTGKKRLANALLRYCRENGIHNYNEKLFVFKCSEKQKNIKEMLLGTKDHEGFLSKADRGILFFERIELMTLEAQEILANYLSLGNERKKNRGCILFTSESEGISECLKEEMIVTYLIPDLKNRSRSERSSLACMFFRIESKTFHKSVKISNFAFQTLTSIDFINHIDGLHGAIIKALAHANMNSDETTIVVKTFNMVDLISDYSSFLTSEGENKIYTLEEIEQQIHQDDLLDQYDQLITLYEKYTSTQIHKSRFKSETSLLLNTISDYLILNMNIDNDKINGLKVIITNICDLVKQRCDIYIYNDMVLMLSKVIYKLAYLDSNIQEWTKQNDEMLQEIKTVYIEYYPEAAAIAQLMENLLYQFIEIKIDSVTFLNIINIIASENDNVSKEYYALIIAHGYATASSIANATNKLIGKHIFDAIDMTLDTNAIDIAYKIDEYIENAIFIKNLILIVDMGSLEEISSLIHHSSNVKIGIINNVSTRMALAVGEGIQHNQSIEKIMKQACKYSLSTFKILSQETKEQVLVFVSEAGASVSNRIMQLFKSSLPRKIEAKIISYDYFELMKNMENDSVFQSYDVLLIVGINKKISNYPYIAFEELLAAGSITILDSVLRSLSFQEEELRIFNDNILKYFSLENVMNTITILNAKVLIDLIEDALKKLQKALSIRLEPKIVYGLYVHLSSLIERLVIKSRSNLYSNIDQFEAQQQDFIKSVRESFDKLTRYYNVEIPLSEIAYLYDYIMNWI